MAVGQGKSRSKAAPKITAAKTSANKPRRVLSKAPVYSDSDDNEYKDEIPPTPKKPVVRKEVVKKKFLTERY